MLMAATRDTLDAYWSAYYGRQPAIMEKPGVWVAMHAADAGYRGVSLFHHGETCLVGAPPEDVAQLRAMLEPLPAAQVFDRAALATLLGARVDRVIGPAWLGYVDEGVVHQSGQHDARPLTQADAPALRRLVAVCEQAEWEESGIELDAPHLFGYCIGDELGAAGQLKPWGERLLHIGVITHPRFRGRGYGRAVVGAMTRYALGQGAIPQYRALICNVASVRLAKSLGFEEYARTLAVRLRS